MSGLQVRFVRLLCCFGSAALVLIQAAPIRPSVVTARAGAERIAVRYRLRVARPAPERLRANRGSLALPAVQCVGVTELSASVPMPAPAHTAAAKLETTGEPIAQTRGEAPPRFSSLALEPGHTAHLQFATLSRVVVGDPAVADVVPVSSRDLVIVGKGEGATTVMVWDGGQRHIYRVEIARPRTPPLDLEPVVRRLQVEIGDPNIRVRALGNAIFLEGEVTDAHSAQRAELMAQALAAKVHNLIRVAAEPVPPPPPPPPPSAEAARILNEALGKYGCVARAVSANTVLVEGTVSTSDAEQIRKMMAALAQGVALVDGLVVAAPAANQVLIRARVVDINRTRLRDLGVDWGQVLDVNGQRTIVDQPFLFGIFGRLDGNLNVNPLDEIGFRLSLLVQENAARILSEPNLLVMEGAQGSILVGGEFPIPVVQATTTAVGSVTVEFKEFGVKLAVQPIRVADGQIVMRVAPEVSLLDFGNAVRISGFTLPALRTRREDSVIRIASGQTLAIGGLIENNYSRIVKRIPFLSDLPVLGEFFRSRSFLRNETELVILITPEIVPPGGAVRTTPLAEEAPRYPIPRPQVPPSVRPRTPPAPGGGG